MAMCLKCNREFKPKPSTVGKYCSAECSLRRVGNRGDCGRPGEPHVDCKCANCGLEFSTFASRVKLGRGVYCSRECHDQGRQEERVTRTCNHCGKMVLLLPYRIRRKSFMCSKACRAAANKDGCYLTCENPQCNKVIYRGNWRIELNKHNFCSQKCRSTIIHGANHHLWEGGIDSHDKRREHEFTFYQKRLILEQDNYTCVLCHDETADVLHVDHIKAICNGGTRDIGNGRTLCIDCHKTKTNQDRAEKRARKKAA